MVVLQLAVTFFVLVNLPTETDTCAASGICGMQPYCYGSSPYYSQYPSGGGYQSPYNCGRCATAYGCGSYGCYRMRAAGSKSFQPGKARGNRVLRRFEQARLAAERGEDYEINEIDNLEFASPTAALVRRHPMAQI
ncbi:hypothetical protein FO519_006570 [Halicephalobus sp. NKZ332]|nr:hypothetical protein FO519_006570 [Halicephalobus sp. NKZ332]